VRANTARLPRTGSVEVIDEAHRLEARGYFHQEDFFVDIPVMPDSPEVVRALMQCNEVFITTAAMDVPKSFNAKFHWLQTSFPVYSHEQHRLLRRQKHYCGGLFDR